MDDSDPYMSIFFFMKQGIGDGFPNKQKPARYTANQAEIEQVPFCAVTRPRLQCYAEKLDVPHEKA